MSKTKQASHTPGPWFVVFGNAKDHIGFRTTQQNGNIREGAVCQIEHDRRRRCEADANARLIAAAPELLEACEAIYRAIGDKLTYEEFSKLGDVVDLLPAALCKATGAA